jgi:uncharacterized protein (DUF427 family)
MPHATASVNGVVVAQTDQWEVVDGNIYVRPTCTLYPASLPSIITWISSKSHFSPTSTKTHCPYKGDASYYTVTTNKTEVQDAAWYYPDPLPSMNKIKGYVAFYKSKAEVKSE